jgi:hypothetical protein
MKSRREVLVLELTGVFMQNQTESGARLFVTPPQILMTSRTVAKLNLIINDWITCTRRRRLLLNPKHRLS